MVDPSIIIYMHVVTPMIHPIDGDGEGDGDGALTTNHGLVARKNCLVSNIRAFNCLHSLSLQSHSHNLDLFEKNLLQTL